MTIKEFTDKLFRDKDGQVVLFQFPNAPLFAWGVATIATHLLHGNWQSFSGFVAFVAILVWAVLEILWGNSVIRRILGVVVFVLVLANRF